MEIEKKIKAGKVVEVVKQEPAEPRYKVKAPSRGGARKGAGRKKGGKNKVIATDLLLKVEEVCGKEYAQIIAEQLNEALLTKDARLVKDYLEFIGKKVIADKSEMDVTTQGEAIQGSFVFMPAELPEWNNVK